MTRTNADRTLRRKKRGVRFYFRLTGRWLCRGTIAKESVQMFYFGTCGVMKAATGTSMRARMKPREKLMRAVQPSSTARYSTATSFSTFQPCSVPSPDKNLQQTARRAAHTSAQSYSKSPQGSTRTELQCKDDHLKLKLLFCHTRAAVGIQNCWHYQTCFYRDRNPLCTTRNPG